MRSRVDRGRRYGLQKLPTRGGGCNGTDGHSAIVHGALVQTAPYFSFRAVNAPSLRRSPTSIPPSPFLRTRMLWADPATGDDPPRLSKPEKEHDRGSRPRPSPGPPSGRSRCDADIGVAPVGEAPVGEAPVAAGVLWRDPRVATPSQDPLCLSLHARPSLSLSRGRPTAPYEGENLFPETGRTGPCEGETLLPEVGRTPGPCVSPLTGENKRGLAAQGVCDSPIG